MMGEHHKEVLNALTSKGAESPTNDADHDDNKNGSSSSFEDLNFRGFTNEEAKFDGTLDPIASTKWLSAVDDAFRTSCCKENDVLRKL
ncbi:hypothetical protein Tco_0544079 [Tanacetum coccineum]